jgi:signal transduction histidine kinase
VRLSRLTTKFFLATALVTLVALGTLGALAVTMSQASLRERIAAHNRTTATLTARAVERYVMHATDIVREATNRPKLNAEISSANWPEASRVLDNLLRHFPLFDAVSLLDTDGVLRARVPHAEAIGQNFAFRDVFREAMEGRTSTSGVFVSRASGRAGVAIAVPVFVGSQGVRAVLAGILSLEQMNRLLLEIGLEDGSVVYVVDGQGTLVAHSAGLRAREAFKKAPDPVLAAIKNGRPTSLELRDGDTLLLGAFAPLAALGWGVVAAKPTAVAYGVATRLGWWLGGIAVACAVAAGLLGFALARHLTRPLIRLTRGIEKLAVGEFTSVRVPVEGDDEVSQLARSFNEMGLRLESSYRALEEKTREVQRSSQELARELEERRRVDADLRRLNEDLERRVQERTRRVEAVNGELEAFTYTVSHDLKAPLRAMDGFARALEEDYPDQLDATGRRYLGIIRSSASRMGMLIDDLLRYSRLERRELHRERVALRPLLTEVCADLQEETRERGLTIDLALEIEAVHAERQGLREALANLVGNAVKFTPEPGGRITVASRQEGDTVVLSVTDSGIGFDMQYHDRIFRIFERLHTQSEYPGTGVGLGIVRKVAERHEGRAWAVSEPGRGSTFSLALPVNGGVA